MRFAYLAVLCVFGWLALLARSDRAKDVEIATLRHPVAVPQRQVKTPRLSGTDRDAGRARTDAARSRLRQLCVIVSPRTLLRWYAHPVRRNGPTRTAAPDGRGQRGPSGRWSWIWPGTTLDRDPGAFTAS
jgi:hypothetical protein